jgi:hypothetical protein
MKKSYTLLLLLTLFSNFVFAKNIYVSKSTGTNEGDGSEANPFFTIGQAVGAAVDNDVIYLMDGIFRETVSITKSNITIISENQDVYITGTDIITGFEDLGGGLYKAYVPNKVTQLFIDGIPQVNAKFPNQDLDADNLFNFTTINVTYDDANKTLTSNDITQPDDFFTGATIWMIVGARWVSTTAKVKKQTGNVLELTEVSVGYDGPGIAFISNNKNCIDNDNEWYWGNDTLFYKNSTIDISSIKVEAKTRETLFNLENATNVTIDSINGYAGNILLNNTKYCKISNSNFKYLNEYDYFGDGAKSYCRGNRGNINSYGLGIAFFGTSDTLYRCKVEYAAGDCITMYGYNNVVSRCIVHDGDYRGNDCGAISLGGSSSSGNIIQFCEVYNGGRDLISASSSKHYKILYNKLYRTGLIAWDLGIIYTWGTDGEESEIAYNHISEAYSGNPDETWGAVGVYLDNGSSNYLVHHNVIHDIKGLGMQINYPGYNIREYHNTIYNTARAMGAVGDDRPGVTPGKCNLFNNYADKRLLDLYWTNLSHNLVSETDYLQDRDNDDFIPDPSSHLVNTGMFIKEMISVPFFGDGPDLGAYEYGRVPWEVGPDAKVIVVPGDKVLHDASGMIMRGTPMILGKKLKDYVSFATNQDNWNTIKNNGFNTVRLSCVDSWYKDRGEESWNVSEVLPYIDSCVVNAVATGMNVIINYHNPRAQDNYDTSFSFEQEKVFWNVVAERYKDNELVFFELVDEPTYYLDRYENSDFKAGLLDVYETVRTHAPNREVLMFSFTSIDNQIVEVVNNYKEELNWDKTSVAYHMYNLGNSAAIQSLMADYRVICTEMNYCFVDRMGDKDIVKVDDYKENAQALEMIHSSWIDWREWNDTTLNVLLDTLIVDAREKDYWWGQPVTGINVTGVNIIPDSMFLNWGESKQLIYNIYPALSENQSVTWSSTTNINVNIDENGYVTTKLSVRHDTVTVYVETLDGGYRDSCFLVLSPPAGKCSYPNCSSHVVPGDINSTFYDLGGEGVGYHDLSPGNSGNGIRQEEDVDTDYGLEEGSVTAIQSDEWLEYTINVIQDDNYNFEILFATTSRYGKIHIEIDGVDITGAVRVRTTGSFDTFKPTVINNISLTKGLHLVRIYFDAAYYNMGTISIKGIVSGINNVENANEIKLYPNPVKNELFISSNSVLFKKYSIRTLTGQILMQNTFKESQSVNVRNLPSGYYIITLSNGNLNKKLKFIKF